MGGSIAGRPKIQLELWSSIEGIEKIRYHAVEVFNFLSAVLSYGTLQASMPRVYATTATQHISRKIGFVYALRHATR